MFMDMAAAKINKRKKKEEEEKEREDTCKQICWCIWFTIVLCIAILALLFLAFITREYLKLKESETTITSSCENELEIRILEFNKTFKQSLLHLCNVTCSRRAQDTYIAGVFLVVKNDTPAQTARCMACCQQLNGEDCNNTSLDDGFPHPDCVWIETVDGGGGCISHLPVNVAVPGRKKK